MRIELTETFQSSLRSRNATERAGILEAILALPKAFQSPHEHSGLGLRKIHAQGIWEIRVGLDLRLSFRLERNTAVLECLGNHDEIRQYLRRV